MTEATEGPSVEVTQALMTGAPQRVGRFAFYFQDRHWEWSDQVMGNRPGSAPGVM